jgi:uncharacterized membrane protein
MLSLSSQRQHHIGKGRLLAVDILRGFAMVLVILNHAYQNVNREMMPYFLEAIVMIVTNLSAVAFVFISGSMFSYFLYTQSEWKTIYRRYAARAALFLLFAHPAINFAANFYRLIINPGRCSFYELMTIGFPITDTIALCMLLSPLIIMRCKPALRAFIIIILWVITVPVVVLINPTEPYSIAIKKFLFGAVRDWNYPIVPWLAIFLSGSFMGSILNQVKQGTLELTIGLRKMNKIAVLLAVCCIMLLLGHKLLKVVFQNIWSPDLFDAIYPRQTNLLLPGYLAVLSWLFSFYLKRINISGLYGRIDWLLSIIGRTSLFFYIVQFALVFSIPDLLHYNGSLGLLGFLTLSAMTLIVTWLLSYLYGHYRGWFARNDFDENVSMARAESLTYNQ